MSAGNFEIERKYLIAMPDPEALRAANGEIWAIVQTYLLAEPGCTHRVRRIQTGAGVRCYETVKRRLTALTAREDESEIDEARYRQLLDRADPSRRPIEKVRHRIPYAGHVLEVDLYPFWSDRAILEIELSSESERADIPDWIVPIKEVTDDVRYKNVMLAREIPID